MKSANNNLLSSIFINCPISLLHLLCRTCYICTRVGTHSCVMHLWMPAQMSKHEGKHEWLAPIQPILGRHNIERAHTTIVQRVFGERVFRDRRTHGPPGRAQSNDVLCGKEPQNHKPCAWHSCERDDALHASHAFRSVLGASQFVSFLHASLMTIPILNE